MLIDLSLTDMKVCALSSIEFITPAIFLSNETEDRVMNTKHCLLDMLNIHKVCYIILRHQAILTTDVFAEYFLKIFFI